MCSEVLNQRLLKQKLGHEVYHYQNVILYQIFLLKKKEEKERLILY